MLVSGSCHFWQFEMKMNIKICHTLKLEAKFSIGSDLFEPIQPGLGKYIVV